MYKIILVALLSFASLQAQSTAGACIPIGKIVVLKKAIMSLSLSKAQKEQIASAQDTLQTKLDTIKSTNLHKEKKLSNFFVENKFERAKFIKIASKDGDMLATAVADYFETLYGMLNKAQQIALLKKFQRIEKRETREE